MLKIMTDDILHMNSDTYGYTKILFAERKRILNIDQCILFMVHKIRLHCWNACIRSVWNEIPICSTFYALAKGMHSMHFGSGHFQQALDTMQHNNEQKQKQWINIHLQRCACCMALPSIVSSSTSGHRQYFMCIYIFCMRATTPSVKLLAKRALVCIVCVSSFEK